MYVLKMLANMGGSAEKAKYFTFFTLFDAEENVAGESGATAGVFILLIGGIALFQAGMAVFCKKDLHI